MTLRAYKVSFKPCQILSKILDHGNFLGLKFDPDSLILLFKIKRKNFIVNNSEMIKVIHNNRSKCLILNCKNDCPIKFYLKNYYINKFNVSKKAINIYFLSTDKPKIFNNNQCLITIESIKTKDLIITENERMIISEILREGYLEYPKRITLRQLARKLRRSRTGTMLMLRRVFKKLINTAM